MCPIRDKAGNSLNNQNTVYLVGEEDDDLRTVYTARTDDLKTSDLEVSDSEDEEGSIDSDIEITTTANKPQDREICDEDSPNLVREDPQTPTGPWKPGAIRSKDYIINLCDKEPGEISDDEAIRGIQATRKRKRKAKFEIDS